MPRLTAPETEIEAITGVAPAAEPPAREVAFTRMLVKRNTRERPASCGGSIGTPEKLTLLPLTTPWKTLGRPALPSNVPCPLPVPATRQRPFGSLHANWVLLVPAKPLPGSSIMSSASDQLLA